MRLLQAQRPADAAQRFDDPQWQGYARYLAGDFAGAAEQFAKSDTPSAHFNRGNALARNDELQAAIEAYDQALELDPDLESARRNKAIVEGLLRQREEQAQQEQQEQQEQPSEGQPAQEKPPEQPEPPPPTSSPAAGQRDASEASDQQEPGNANEAAEAQASQPPEATEQGEAQDAPEQPREGMADPEQDQATAQWLRRIPDNPGELLRRKFLLEQRKRQELNR